MVTIPSIDRNSPAAESIFTVHPPVSYANVLNRGLASIEPLTRAALYLSLAVIYFWFGGMKFTDYEAQGLVPLVSNSPVLSWFYDILSVRDFSTFLGFIEVSIGLLVLAGLVRPLAGVLGGLLSAGLFVTTLSFMASTPGVFEPTLGFPAITVAPGQFLLKDLGLLAISLWIATDAARQLRAQ
ncbi:MAG: DUF417 family protein [Rhodospirillaceae bacterium]|nr:MAG: DUF417 family protein [Rhodospirillaceae bacterium]